MPQLTSQPASAEGPRTSQLQAAEFHLYAVQHVGWHFPVIREQTHGSVVLFLFVENLQRLAPCGLLLVVDLAQIQGSYPESAIEVERFRMQQVAVGVGGLNPRFI